MILGVDPGLRGALALYDGAKLTVVDVPTYTRKAGARNRDRDFIDEPALFSAVTHLAMFADWLVIEQVGGIPSQSAPSAFVFGRGVGVIIGAAIASQLQREEVAPATWKSALKVPADKRAARARASEIFPAYSNLWTLAKHDGRAEASLIAYWGWKVKGALDHV